MDILSEKNYRSYDYISRYSIFPYYYNKLDEKYIYGTTAQLDENIAFVLHTVAANDSFDSLALKYYNNPTLYWIICDFNRIQDPYTKLKIGQKLKIPNLSTITFKNSEV